MYRLIAPVVDYANTTLGYRAYFEFNQTSAHKTSQSVDIALLDGDQPVVLVEAKRLDRRIGAEQISKYLTAGSRGLVSNGVTWVMCLEKSSKVLKVCHDADFTIAVEAIDEVVQFIRGGNPSHSGWSTANSYADPIMLPRQPQKELRARRVSSPVHRASTLEEMRSDFNQLSHASRLELLLLSTIADEFQRMGGIPNYLRCDVRRTRVSFYDERGAGNGRRLGRIEFGEHGKQHPDILVRTDLVELTSDFHEIAISTPHVKGPHMRRFRLSSDSQTIRFAGALVRAFCR